MLDWLGIPSSPCRMVEMGIGKGMLLSLLGKKFPAASLVGIDKNTDKAQETLLQKNLTDIELIKADIRRTSLQPASADYIFYYNLVHHLSVDDIKQTFLEAHRLLTKKGKIIVIDISPSRHSKPQELLKKAYDIEAKVEKWLGRDAEHIFAPASVSDFLSAVGFRVLRRKIFHDKMVTLPPEAWRAMKTGILAACRKLPDEEKTVVEREIDALDKEIAAFGLALLPSYVLCAEKP